MQLTELSTARIAIFGFGREGRAARRWLRSQFPQRGLTLFCAVGERDEALALGDPLLQIVTDAATLESLRAFDVVVKSPGISPYRTPIPEATAAGVQFTSGSALWFAGHRQARTICVTGTKGKSTTSALIAHLLRSIRVRTALCGNIGMPLLELTDASPPPQCWVIELSSFQTRDFAGTPTVAVITNLIEEHLDWHGSVERYIGDKLRILDHAETRAVLNAGDDVSRERITRDNSRWFNHAEGWHFDRTHIRLGTRSMLPLATLSLRGAHNAGNACAALTALDAAGFDAIAALPALTTFRPLPHRLQSLGVRDGIEFVNDSIATTPQATIAALDHYAGRQIALILGGQDRGLDWQALRDHLLVSPPHLIVCTGATSVRILPLLRAEPPLAASVRAAETFAEAFTIASSALSDGGVLLMSPGAPSFGQFRDYVERGKMFARLAGFDPEAITGIEGLGIA